MGLISIAPEDIAVGVPLAWPVYDEDGNILAKQGTVVESAEQLRALLASNPLRELTMPSVSAAPAADAAETGPKDTSPGVGEDSESIFTFQDMRLRVGDRIQLQPPATVSLERFFVRMIGYVEGVSLMVTSPLENGLRLPLRENDQLVARNFSSQKAFGFGCTVQRVCKIPFDYLHLSFPDKIQGSVIRKAPRVRTNIITSIGTPDTSDSVDKQSGVIVNLSADGALIKSRKALSDKGQVIQLSFRVNLHNIDAYLTATAIVRSIFADETKDEKGSAMLNHGVQFQNLPPNDSMILQSLIYQHMIEMPQSLT